MPREPMTLRQQGSIWLNPGKLGVLPAVDPELASSRPVTETAGIVRPTAAIQQTTSIVSRKRLPSLRLGSVLRCLVSLPDERTPRLIAPPRDAYPICCIDRQY